MRACVYLASVICVLVLFPGSRCGMAADDPDLKKALEVFNEASSLADKGKYDEARAKFEESIKLYEKVLEKDPNNKSAAGNAQAARKNVLWTYDADGLDKIKSGSEFLEQAKYKDAAELFDAAVKGYELAVKAHPDNKGFKTNLKYAKIKVHAAKGLSAIANKETAPDFALPDLEGKTIKLSELRGKVVLLDFWAVWCPPCKELMPTLEELYAKHKDKGFVVLGLNVDKTEGYNKRSANKAQEFAKEKIPYPVLWATDEVLWDYGEIPSLPSVFLIGKDGKVYRRYKYEEQKKEIIEKDIADLLAQP